MIDKNKLINYSSVRGLFEDSTHYGFDYFKSRIDFSIANGFMANNTELNDELIQMHLDDKASAKQAIKTMDEDIIELLNSETNIVWEDVFTGVGRNNVFNIFYNMNNLSDKDYWMILGYCYTTSDFAFADSELIKSMFQAERQHREFLMNEQERSYLNSLPQELTIYRGCSVNEINSNQFRYSWTLSKEIAEFFTYGYRRNAEIQCCVVSKKISKSSVIAYFNDRTEEEILFIE